MCRLSPASPDAQNTQPIAQPICVEMHSVTGVGAPSPSISSRLFPSIVKDGVVTREGKIASGRDGAPPYPIGYDAIVPKKSECENLLVTFAVSASHTAPTTGSGAHVMGRSTMAAKGG